LDNRESAREWFDIADKEDCLMLTDFSVTVRYPFHLDLDESDMVMALERSIKIKEFVLKISSLK